jgi:hypothetical protein
MIAYLFWHAPGVDVTLERYEGALIDFHRSLERTPPFGFCGSAVFRVATTPWAAGPEDAPAYEDWYLVEDFAALGVLNEAAVGRGHRTSHDRAAKGLRSGTAGLYRLIEGEVASAQPIAACPHATWVTPGAGTRSGELGALLGDGLERGGASLWQRQLVLGPAPEFCALSLEDPIGTAPARLAAGWSASSVAHEALFGA